MVRTWGNLSGEMTDFRYAGPRPVALALFLHKPQSKRQSHRRRHPSASQSPLLSPIASHFSSHSTFHCEWQTIAPEDNPWPRPINYSSRPTTLL